MLLCCCVVVLLPTQIKKAKRNQQQTASKNETLKRARWLEKTGLRRKTRASARMPTGARHEQYTTWMTKICAQRAARWHKRWRRLIISAQSPSAKCSSNCSIFAGLSRFTVVERPDSSRSLSSTFAVIFSPESAVASFRVVRYSPCDVVFAKSVTPSFTSNFS